MFARLLPEHDDVVETVEYIQPGKQDRQSAQIRAITYAPIEWTHPGVGIIKTLAGEGNNSSIVQKPETGLTAMLDRMQQKADAMQKDADAALAKARQEAAGNQGGKPLGTTDKLLLVAVLVLLAAATIVSALK